MEINIKTSDLQPAVSIVKDTLGNGDRGHAGIRLYASKKNNRIKLTSFDGMHYTEVWVDARVKTGGKTVIKGDRFVKSLQKIDSESLTIKIEKEGSVKVKSKRGQQTFQTFDESEFPEVPKIKTLSSFSLSGEMYKELIASVAFAAAQNTPDKPYLEGLHMNITSKFINLSATDGIMVSYFRKRIKAEKMRATLSRRALANSVKAVKNDEEVQIQMSDTLFVIKIGDASYYVPQLAGAYPDLKKILPDEFESEFTADKTDFLRLLERSSIILESKGVAKGTLNYEKGGVIVKGKSEEGQFDEKMNVSITGKFDSVMVDIKKLIDIIKHIDADVIRVGLRGKQPISIRPEGRKDQTCLLAVG